METEPTETHFSMDEPDPRAQALLRRIEDFFARRARAGTPLSEYRFGIDIRYPQLLDRLRAGSSVGYSVTQRVNEYITRNTPPRSKRGHK